MRNKKKTILLSVGGTGGSVSPLLAIAKYLKDDYNFKWIVSRKGVERKMLKKERISFVGICSGKLRRYFSLRNFIDPFLIAIGFYQSLYWLIRYRPSLTISAGSFVSVPVVWAAKLLFIPSIIHQQDIRPGLANKLMAPYAKIITTVFEKSVADYGDKAQCIGNPSYFDDEKTDKWPIKNNLPLLLIVGGGTGAKDINDLVFSGLDDLLKFCQIIHITGKDKGKKFSHSNYYPFDFVDHGTMLSFIHQADLVVSRSGLATLTELTYFAKPAILIPIPDTHQEDNAKEFDKHKACLVLDQDNIDSADLVKEIKRILDNDMHKRELSENIKKVIKIGAEKEMAILISKFIKK